MSQSPLARSWDLIDAAQQPRKGEFRVSASEVICGPSPILLALDDGGKRHLLVPLGIGSAAVSDRRSAGVHLRSIDLEEAGSKKPFLDVGCRKRHLNEVFTLLAGEMLEGLRADCRDPLHVCRGVLSRWRELLDREPGQILSFESLLGLYSELTVLRELVRHDPASLLLWTGPLGTPFDFTSPTLALEAKGVAGGGWSVLIHGLEQLDAPQGTRLILCVSQFQSSDAAGESVPEIVDELVRLGADQAVLLARLARVDYLASDREYYASTKFRLMTTRMWHVDGDFPRIIRRSFVGAEPPREIKTVTYVLDLAGLAGRAMNPDEVNTTYGELSSTGRR